VPNVKKLRGLNLSGTPGAISACCGRLLPFIFKSTFAQKPSGKKVYNALPVPFLLYGSVIWNLIKKDKKLLTSIEIKFFRTTGYIFLDHKKSEEILEELKVKPVNEKLRR